MKNIFKLMGVALIASTMLLASCGKEGNDDNNDNGDNSGNNPTPAKSVATVTYGLDTWNVTDFGAAAKNGVLTGHLYKSDNDNDPMVEMNFGTSIGTYTYNNNGYYLLYIADTNDYILDPATYKYYPRHQPYSTKHTISAIDLSNSTISATVEAQVYDRQAYLDNDSNINESMITDVNINLENAKWRTIQLNK